MARAQIGPDNREKTGHWLDSYVAYAEISEQTEWPVFFRDTSKWIEVTSQKGVSSTATASAQFAGRAVQLSRNVRQSDHIFVNEIAGHKVKRGPGAGEEWLAATKHDGVDVESILVNQTQVR